MSVHVEQLTKAYSGTTPAIAAVSFTAPEGGITTLLGPSGSGKSTALRVIAGLEVPDSGTVRFGPRDVTDVPPQKRGVGLVFQSYALFDHMRVRDNVAFGLSVRGVPKREIDDRVRTLLSRVQLEGLEARFPAELSGGQRQRVAFARALATEPSVLLLDEPFGALDTRVRVELRDWLIRLHHDTKLTTILVTHDQDEALEVSDHLVVMNHGRVEQSGPPHEVYDRPTTPFVASFVGGSSVLQGLVRDGRAAVASLAVAPPDGARDGDRVRAFVRAHDVDLARVESHASDVSLATIERVARAGGVVRIALRLPNGQSLNVTQPHAQFVDLGVHQGDRVMVNLRDARVFLEDYAL